MKDMMEFMAKIPYFGLIRPDLYWAQWPRHVGSGLGPSHLWPEAINTRAYGTMRNAPGRWYWSSGGVQFNYYSLNICMFAGIDIGSWQ